MFQMFFLCDLSMLQRFLHMQCTPTHTLLHFVLIFTLSRYPSLMTFHHFHFQKWVSPTGHFSSLFKNDFPPQVTFHHSLSKRIFPYWWLFTCSFFFSGSLPPPYHLPCWFRCQRKIQNRISIFEFEPFFQRVPSRPASLLSSPTWTTRGRRRRWRSTFTTTTSRRRRTLSIKLSYTIMHIFLNVTTGCPIKKWLSECCWSHSAPSQSPVAGTSPTELGRACIWNFFWSFLTKTKQDQATKVRTTAL